MSWHALLLVVAILSIAQCETCDHDEFACNDTCIKAKQRCDGEEHCTDGSDEKDCSSYHLCDWGVELQCPRQNGKECSPKSGVCTLPGWPHYNTCDNSLDLVDCPCESNYVRCDDTQKCVLKSARCDTSGCGENALGCNYNQTAENCPSGYFECMDLGNATALCHPNSMMCDGVQDCYNNEEAACAGPTISFTEPRWFYTGETYTLVAKISGKPQPNITLLKYEMLVDASDRIIIDYPTSTDPNINERDYTVTFKDLGFDNIGSYKIFAENKGYNEGDDATSDKSRWNTELSREIIVRLKGGAEVSNLNVTDPNQEDLAQNLTLLQEESYTMYCNVYGSPRPEVTFFKDNDDITNNSNYIISSETNHAGQNQTIWKLTIARLVRDEHMGSYKCYAENAMSEEYIIVNLDINIKPKITFITENLNVKTGANVTLECSVEGFPEPSITWSGPGLLSGSTLSKINLTNVAIAGAPHLYTCKAENDYGAVMKDVTINVYNAPEIPVEDFVVEHEVSWSHQFNVIAVDLNRTYIIMRDGKVLNAESEIWTHSAINEQDTMVILLETVNETSYDHIGNYTITVSNDIASTSEEFRFEVEIMPELTLPLPANVTMGEGSQLELRVTVLAYPHPTYSWFINGSKADDYTEAILSKRAEVTDNGTYTVEASNVYGSVNTTTVVTVTPFGCANEPCQNNATCNDLGNSQYNCTCNKGFSGQDCETNNWCEESYNPCQHDSNCSTLNYPDNYQCECAFAHRGDDCEETIDFCDEGGNKKCGVDEGRGKCEVTGLGPDGFQCYCKYTYGGMFCDQIQHCTPNPCENDGSCVVSGGVESCECPDAYEGAHCETKKEWWCDGKCNGRARCYEKTEKRCLCEYPWVGDACQTILSKPLHFHFSVESYLLSNLDTLKEDRITQSVELPLLLGDQAPGKLILLTQYTGRTTNTTGDQVWVTMDENRILTANVTCSNSNVVITLPNSVPAHTPLMFRFRTQFNRAKLSVTSYHTKDMEHEQTMAANLPSSCAQFREQRIGNYRADNIDMYMWDSVVIGSTIVRHGEDGLWTRGREIFGAEPCAVNLCNNGGACAVVEGQELCKCAEGYLGPHCNEMLDQCMNIECMNSGECEQGACVCSLGFTGVLCESEMQHDDYVLSAGSKLMFGLESVEEFSMTFTASADLDAVHMLTLGADMNLVKFGIVGEQSYITVIRGNKKGVYSGPFVPSNETVYLNMTMSAGKITVTIGANDENNNVSLTYLPANTGSLAPRVMVGNVRAGSLTVDSVSGNVLSGSNVGSSEVDPCKDQCNQGNCQVKGENSIECSDCPADTDPLTCASISCVPGCDGKCTDLGYCSCDMHHHGDRCQQVLDLSNGFPATVSQQYSTIHYKGTPVKGYNINVMFSVKLHDATTGLIARASGNGGQRISWHLVDGPAVKFSIMVDGEMMSTTLELSSVGEWMVLGFTQDCSKGQVTCEMLLSAGGESTSSQHPGAMWSLSGDVVFGAQGEKGVIASFAYPVIGLIGQEESLSGPVGGMNIVRDVDHVCDVIPSPCQNGGTCKKTSDQYSCSCTGDWTGDHCERQKTDCDDVRCVEGSVCVKGRCLCNYPILQSAQCNIRSSSSVGLCAKDGYFVMKGLAPAMVSNSFVVRFNVKLSEQGDGERSLFGLNGGSVLLTTDRSTALGNSQSVHIKFNKDESVAALYGWNTVVLTIQYKSVSLRVNNVEVLASLDSPISYDGTVRFGQLSSMESDGACVSCVSMSNSMHSTVLDQVVEGYGVTSCVEQVVEEAESGQYGSAELWDMVQVL